MRLRRTAVLLLLAGVGLLAVAGLVVGVRDWSGEDELEAALAATAADEAWLAALPEVDSALRDRAWAWMKTSWPVRFTSAHKQEAWFLRGEAPPAEVRERHEAARPHMRELMFLLAQPDLCLSSAAWARTELADPTQLGPKHIPNLLHCRYALSWFGVESMLADDPQPALDAIDRLCASMTPAGSLIDALIAIAMADTRDHAYLRLIQRGALPRHVVTRWLGERPTATRAVLDAYRGERLLLWGKLAASMLRGGDEVLPLLFADGADLGQRMDVLWHGKRDAAYVLRSHRLFERFLEEGVPTSAFEELEARREAGGTLAQMGVPHHRAVLWSVVVSRAKHRIRRLLVRAARLPGGIPADDAELRTSLPRSVAAMAYGRLELALRYERVGADRIRIYVPADTPLPELLEPSRASYGIEDARKPAKDVLAVARDRHAVEMTVRP